MTLISLHAFLLDYRGAGLDELQAAFPAGCLLTRANPSESNRVSTEVFPLLPCAPPRPIRLGRAPELEVCLACSRVSKLHAQFEPSPRGLALRDLGSVNGTYLNGRRLGEEEAALLEPGTNELWFADVQLFHFDAGALATYLRHLGEGASSRLRAELAAEREQPSEPPPAALGRTRRVQRPRHDHSATAELRAYTGPELDDDHDQRWQAALTTLDGVLGSTARLVLRLALQEEPVTIFEAKDGDDPAATRAVLEGLRSVVVEVRAVLERSGYELVLFRK
ncbi:MAG: FHA domain-containing protein [Planctomycetota bacterium]